MRIHTDFHFLKRAFRGILGLILSVSVLSVPAFAAPAEAVETYCGYLVRVNENPTVARALSSVDLESVCPEAGLFYADTLEQVFALEEQGVLINAEPNYMVELFALPDDPYVTDQWAYTQVEADRIWDIGLDGRGVRIGVIDSGLAMDHSDLIGSNVLTGYNYITETTDVADTFGHGTMVTGIIAAQKNNREGMAGLADGAEIVPLKCFAGQTTSLKYILPAIYDAVDVYDCQIINISFGMGMRSEELQTAVAHAVEQGTIIVAAVGNGGGAALMYPAAYEGVIGVAAVDEALQHAFYSQYNKSVDIAAPGSEIVSLSISGDYTVDSGTSFACPMVTAAAALMLQARPDLTADELTDCLALSALDLGDAGRDDLYGHGLLQIGTLLDLVMEHVAFGMEETDGMLTIRGSAELDAEDWQAMLVFYRADGKLLRCVDVALEQKPFASMQIPDQASEAKLFFYGSDHVPLRSAVCWNRETDG